MISKELLVACALLLVLEGMLPFLSPRAWRDVVTNVARLDDRMLRAVSLGSMLMGTALLYLVR